MKNRHTFGKQERLKSRKQIEQLFKEGKSINVFPYRVRYLNFAAMPHQSSLQAGIAVSKRSFKKAVHRNRIKRLTREAYRLQKLPLQQKLADKNSKLVLFFMYTGKELPEFLLVKEKVRLILDKLISVVDENSLETT